MLKNIGLYIGFALSLLVIVGCDEEGRGFSLPPGDAETGKEVFQQLGCIGCHSIRGEDLKGDDRELLVILGGPTSRVKSYGDLVTSVINPSHKIARAVTGEAINEDGLSKMKIYNEVMTVQQLVDLVTYLQATYEVLPPTPYYPI